MADEWGPWIDHDGRGCPVRGMWCQIIHAPSWDHAARMDPIEGIAGSQSPNGEGWTWGVADPMLVAEVVRYRVRKPRGLTMLQEIAESVREPERVDA